MKHLKRQITSKVDCGGAEGDDAGNDPRPNNPELLEAIELHLEDSRTRQPQQPSWRPQELQQRPLPPLPQGLRQPPRLIQRPAPLDAVLEEDPPVLPALAYQPP